MKDCLSSLLLKVSNTILQFDILVANSRTFLTQYSEIPKMKLFKLVCGTDKEQSVYIYATSISRQSVFDCQLFSAWEYFLLVVCHGSCWMRWQLDYPWQGRDETPGLLIPKTKNILTNQKGLPHLLFISSDTNFLGMNAESRLFRWKKSILSSDLPHGPIPL